MRTELGTNEANNQAVARTESSHREDKSQVAVRTRQALERTRLRLL